ncbi:hypothetical protein COCSUDRAFT_60632 [Coccomyxa subellipsoidea C-169]|uniref:Uncharacterized protein n=1 Tax=Coccomyxa subellipsoidea (strain C-169) TaxID=574566 RepID=I0YI34_COCSC|nr:hypothetical protein COCSUDRAFT_60632 [Coccomyxa subellipsoidea C-169]EIE18053.1 hypothetical protein COCSUDRAFT_60632 [Coccomyxa subellipsoidea C-169]|eukprot:XP_005642597.1 hypothetical protein COCSUDRAFT_60632 [Coccomyxa subellipsoidea C-169]
MEPSRQEIVAAAQLLRRAAATQSINGFAPAGPAPSPDNWRPHFTPQYPSGSREQLYASALDLCFHCGEKVNVPGKPRIPGAHDRGLHNCPVKMANGMPTPIVVPDAWTPPRKPGFN